MSYKPKYIGTWYESDYKKQVNELLNENYINENMDIKCIIVPHSGYFYSGSILGEIYSLINKENVKNIIMLCTLHNSLPYIYLPNFKEIKYDEDNRKIDIENVIYLSEYDFFKIDNNKFDDEHSFELQLPFIFSVTNENVPILPLLVGHYKDMNKVSDILYNIINPNTLVIISTDFTHYGEMYNYIPFKNSDNVKMEILKKDFNDFNNIFKNIIDKFKGETVCEYYAILLWMNVINKLNYNLYPKLITYETSNDNSNDNNSVSYAGIIYETSKNKDNLNKLYKLKKYKIMIDFIIKAKEKINLLKLCDNNISLIPRLSLMILAHNKTNKDNYDFIMDKLIHRFRLMINDNLEKKAVFVTYEENNDLQGCIGIFYDNALNSKLNMIQLIIKYTLSAIFYDDRFSDVKLRHLSKYKYLYSSLRFNFKINFLDKQFYVKDFGVTIYHANMV